MAYDSNTYGASPFGQTAKRPPKLKDSPLSTNTDLDPAEALSDQGSELRSPDAVSADDIPALPAGYAPVLKSRSRSLAASTSPRTHKRAQPAGREPRLADGLGHRWLLSRLRAAAHRHALRPPL